MSACGHFGGVTRTRLSLAIGLGLAVTSPAGAQNVPAGVNPGQISRQVEALPHPKAEQGVAPPPKEPVCGKNLPQGPAFQLKGLLIEGSTVYRDQTFRPLYAALIGTEVTTRDIRAVCDAVTARYYNDGFQLSHAIIPPQDLGSDGGVVKIRVIEAFVDKVEWQGRFPRHVRRMLVALGKRITAARPTNIKDVERNLLIANSIPGYEGRFTSTFIPSTTTPLAATLVVRLKSPAKPFAGDASVDNRGAAGLGPWEFSIGGVAQNLLGLNESIGLRYVGSADVSELQYYEATYHQLLSANGLSLDAKASYDASIPSLSSLRAIDYKGHGIDVDAGLTYPLFRTRQQSLSLTLDGFLSDITTKVLEGELFNRDRLRGIRAKSAYDFSDKGFFGERAATLVQATLSQGIDGLGSTSNDNPLASRTVGRVDFTKTELLVSRDQVLTELKVHKLDLGQLSAKAELYGQYAFSPLLTAEQCAFGGRDFGRGLDSSAFTGDQCLFESGELSVSRAWQSKLLRTTELYAFADHGELWTLEAASAAFRREIATTTGTGVRLGGPLNTILLLEVSRTFSSLRDDWRESLELTTRY